MKFSSIIVAASSASAIYIEKRQNGTDHFAEPNSNFSPNNFFNSSAASAPNACEIYGAGTAVSAYNATSLEQLNVLRRQHHVYDLVWNDTLANYAAIAVACCEASSGYNDVFGFSYAFVNGGLYEAVAEWEQEGLTFTYTYEDYSDPTYGNFTQMLWAGSTNIGCATNTCSNRGSGVTFCYYEAKGNIAGQYRDNVYPV
ncbi:hypothetical protein CANCADRAFT_3937 [Tortispora caseinolytica NRRL Y-17796]|uniref:SCP domain-containing protein n=1 Tax=Tortispora caseinolytica NRRL Y-17796 TaxID=767744 RepID=A0A1E4TC35_9ASCO|nr:hypothetical protein CANCADRAFT_3937 [Tortispora caseinolytica NRRL Y-17796]